MLSSTQRIRGIEEFFGPFFDHCFTAFLLLLFRLSFVIANSLVESSKVVTAASNYNARCVKIMDIFVYTVWFLFVMGIIANFNFLVEHSFSSLCASFRWKVFVKFG